MTTTDRGKLTRDAQAASIEWAYTTVAAYPGRLAAAAAEVPVALAAFSAAALEDIAAAARQYLEVAARMAEANALGEDLARARSILRQAGVLPPARLNHPDPVGAINAPFPVGGTLGPPALPPFLELLASTIDAARKAAVRRPSAADPGSFDGTASDSMRRAVLAAEYHPDEELAMLAGLAAQAPDRFARLPDDQRAAVAAWLACREAAGHGDEPLPKIARETIRGGPPPTFKPDDTVRVRLFTADHAPRIR